MPKKALVILADGFEETEAITPIDILRRAGMDVTIAFIGKTSVKGAHDINILADKNINEVDTDFDVCVLPGGMPGAANLAASGKVQNIIREMDKNKKLIAAICASPAIVLGPMGILKNKTATCYPGMENQFDSDVEFREEKVVVDGNIITSRGVGTSLLFSLSIVEYLFGKELRDNLQKKTVAD